MAEHHCILCPIYRPDADPRLADRPPVCDSCRRRFDYEVSDIGSLTSQLTNPDLVDTEAPAHEFRGGQPRAVWQGLPVGPVPGRTNQPHVAGSRTPPLPIDVDDVDLTSPARRPNATDEARRYPGDQIGHLSVATRLYEIVRDWRDTLWPDQHLPVPTVPNLVAWLLAGTTFDEVGPRVDEACDRHPAIVSTAAELHALRSALRGAAGETDQQPRRWLGVACKHCKAISELAQEPGEVYIECGACGRMYSDAELAELLAELGAKERAARTREQVTELMRA